MALGYSAEEKEARRQRKRALARLTAIERACLYLWAERNETVEGLARVFGWTESEAQQRLERAQGKLLTPAGG